MEGDGGGWRERDDRRGKGFVREDGKDKGVDVAARMCVLDPSTCYRWLSLGSSGLKATRLRKSSSRERSEPRETF